GRGARARPEEEARRGLHPHRARRRLPGAPRMSSLHARLLAWLLGGVLVVGAAGGFIVYRNALHEADGFYDYQLEQTALILRDEPVGYAEGPHLPPPEAAYDFV